MLNFRSVSLFALAVAVAAPAAAQQQVQSPFAVPGQQAQIRDPLTPQAVPVGASPAPTTGRAVNPAVAHPLNLEQKAWERPDANKGARQIRPGFLHLAWRPDDVPQINVREGLLTTIKFPEQEEIVSNIVSDPGSYETLVAPNRHSIALRALYAGVDGNIVIYGKSGNVYIDIGRAARIDVNDRLASDLGRRNTRRLKRRPVSIGHDRRGHNEYNA